MKNLFSAALLALSVLSTQANVRLPAIFGDHMVLQRDQPVPVWGWADAGEKVTVSFAGKTATATAGADGRWSVKLPALKANSTAATLAVEGKNKVEFEDVLVGEVWLCSGQSNMEWSVAASKDKEKEIAAGNHPRIRHIKIQLTTAVEPQTDVKTAGWKLCATNTVASFTAVGYFFGRELEKNLDVPIGLIGSNWGGTRIEPWTPPVGFQSVPALKSIADNLANFPQRSPAKTKEGKEVLDKDGKPVMNINNQSALAIYNAMIHPLIPYAIRGALWYQGESNNGEGMLYFEKMKALIGGWRTLWQQGDFPFGFVQLAPYKYGGNPENLAGIWEAQTASLSIANTGMAVTTDISTIGNIHPPDKQEVGHRLALWALTKTYGKTGLVYSGPLFDTLTVAGDKATLKFKHAEGGLLAKDGKPLTWFTVAGADKKFHAAAATIEGNNVVVRSEMVAAPVAVRFGWNQLAEPNLANKAGLPASPFRTDKWTDAVMAEAQPK